MKGFTKKQVTEITGLNPRLVQMYTEEGIVHPEIDRGEGRGKVRRYSKGNLFEFLIIRQLSEYGITLSIVRGILHNLRFSHWAHLLAMGKLPHLAEQIEASDFGKLEDFAKSQADMEDDIPTEMVEDLMHKLRMDPTRRLDGKISPFTDFMERYEYEWSGMRLSVYQTKSNERGFGYISEVEELLSSGENADDPIVSYLVIDLELLYQTIKDL